MILIAAPAVTYLVEFYLIKGLLPAGSFLCLLEVLLSFVVVVFLRARNRPSPLSFSDAWPGYCLVAFFSIIAFTDGAYYVLYYYFKVPRTSSLAALLTSFPYSFAYMAGIGAMLGHCRSRSVLFRDWRNAMLPLGLTIPVLFGYLVPAMTLSRDNNGIGIYFLSRILNTTASFVLINIALAIFLRTRNPFWSFFSAGTSIMIIVNWALGTEHLLGQPITFRFYEFLWAFGAALAAVPVFLSKKDDLRYQMDRGFSLVSRYRTMIMVIVILTLLVANTFQNLSLEAIRIVAIGIVLGILVALLFSQLVAEQITLFAQVMGRRIQSSQESLKTSTEDLASFPVELRENFEEVFAAGIESRRLQREAEDRLSQLALQVAHDIRSPLAVLRVVAGKRAEFSEEESSSLIEGAVTRMSEIANSLLRTHQDLSRPESLRALLESLLVEKRFQFESASKIEMELIVELDQEIQVEVEAVELRRMLSNLLSNALEAIAETGRVTVKVGILYSIVSICIQDTGKGIAPEILSLLGQRGASFGKKEGSGLGLYHAYRVVKSLRGELKIESQPNVGTTVTVSIPRGSLGG